VGVAWDEVDVDANGNNLLSAVTHYIVTWTDGTTAASSTIALADLASTAGPPLRYSTVISGLTNGVAYTVTVVARNGDGDSDASTSADATPAATALSDVVLNQSSVKVGSEKNFQFVATPLTADGGTPPNVTLTWMASAGSITQTGNFTAPTGPATVTVSVSATQAGTGATANDSATVEVLAPPAPKPPTPETENPLGDVPAAPPGSTEEAETTIVTPVEGGSVTSRDGAVTVDVKAGSVDAFVGLDVAPVADADVPPVPAALRLKTIGTVVDLTFTDPDGVPIDNFVAGKPVTVTIGYTDADALEASGARNLVIMKYDEAIGAWTALPTTVNLTAKTISAQVRSFSLFGIGAPVEVVVPAEPTATAVPPTAVPATATAVPPTAVPPTAVPPTAVPPTTVPATATPSPDVELPATGDVAPGMAAVIGLMMLGLALVGGGVAIVRRRQLREVSS
jgi:LPXTG-motif cell wall-anchored protein